MSTPDTTPETTPDPKFENRHVEAEKPDTISITDRLRLQLAHERMGRTQAQLNLAQLATQEARDGLRGTETGIMQEYGVNKTDTIDLDTGKITRGK